MVSLGDEQRRQELVYARQNMQWISTEVAEINQVREQQNQSLDACLWNEILKKQLAHEHCETHEFHDIKLAMADHEQQQNTVMRQKADAPRRKLV